MNIKTSTSIFLLSLILCLALLTSVYAQTLTVATDKDVYGPGETIKVSGSAAPNADVTVQIFNPAMQLVDIDITRAGADGKYSVSFRIPDKIPTGQWIYGTYLIKAYMAGQVATKIVEIRLAVTVIGRVVDKAGMPIPEADVVVGPSSGKTLSDGTFTIGLPAEGTYTVKVSKAGYYSYTGTLSAAIGTNNLGTIVLVSYEDKVAELENALAAANKEIADLKSKVDSLTRTVSDLIGRLETLKTEVGALSARLGIVTDLQKSIGELKSSVEDLKATVNTMAWPITQLPILYILTIVALVIAIVAIVLTYRKIVK